MQQAAVQPSRAEHRPPAPEPEHRHRTAGAEDEGGLEVGGEKRQRRAHADVAARPQQRQHIERGAGADDERDEPHVAAERAQHRRKAPQAGIPPPAVVAAVVADPDEHAARRADDRARSLAPEHEVDDTFTERPTPNLQLPTPKGKRLAALS